MSSLRTVTRTEHLRTSGAPPSPPWEVHQAASGEMPGVLGLPGEASVFVSHEWQEPLAFLRGWRIPSERAKAKFEQVGSRSVTFYLDSSVFLQQGLPGQQLGRPFPSITNQFRAGRADDERFVTELDALFEEAPIEDGYDHPAEDLIRGALRDPSRRLLFLRLLGDPSYRHRTSLLRSLGHLPAGMVSWALQAIGNALAGDIELRDAAIQALELWATPEAIRFLREHQEPVPWLSDYVRRVLAGFPE